jgi:hypothetical protein
MRARAALIPNVIAMHTHDGVRPSLKLGQPADVIPLWICHPGETLTQLQSNASPCVNVAFKIRIVAPESMFVVILIMNRQMRLCFRD